MALRAVPDHPKFADLKSRLKCGRLVALGALESVWHFCGRFTPQGNIGKYADHAIEAWVEWEGQPGELIAALVAAGWLDLDPDYRLVVHDWPDHADQATKLALKRKELGFVRTSSRQRNGSVETPSRLPVPVPVPDPVPDPEPVLVLSGARHEPKAVTMAPIITATAPELTPASPPAAPQVFPTKPERQAAANLVQCLAEERDAAGVPVGGIPRAISAASLRLAGVPDLDGFCAELRANHASFLPVWAASKARAPASYVPFLSVWFSEGDCLRRPRAPADTIVDQPQRKKGEPDWIAQVKARIAARNGAA